MGRTSSYWLIYLASIHFTPQTSHGKLSWRWEMCKSEHAQCSFSHRYSTSIPLAKVSHVSEPSQCFGPCSSVRCKGTGALLLSIMSFIPNWANTLTVTSEPCIGNDSKLIFCSPEGVVRLISNVCHGCVSSPQLTILSASFFTTGLVQHGMG